MASAQVTSVRTQGPIFSWILCGKTSVLINPTWIVQSLHGALCGFVEICTCKQMCANYGKEKSGLGSSYQFDFWINSLNGKGNINGGFLQDIKNMYKITQSGN